MKISFPLGLCLGLFGVQGEEREAVSLVQPWGENISLLQQAPEPAGAVSIAFEALLLEGHRDCGANDGSLRSLLTLISFYSWKQECGNIDIPVSNILVGESPA